MKRWVLVGIVALMVSSNAWAAAPLDSGHPLALVQKPSVQKELALMLGQVKIVQSLLAAAVDDETTKSSLATLDKTLEAGQRKRLREISYQVRGGTALAAPEVATRLALRQTQVRKIHEFAKNRELDLKMVLTVTRFKSAAARRQFILDWRKGAADKMLAELTADQKKAFVVLQGKKFAPMR